ALYKLQLMNADNFVAEANAARTKDAAFSIEHHARTDLDMLWFVDFVFLKPAVARAMLIRIILKLALASLVANGTIERMIDEKKFHHRFPRMQNTVGFCID